MRLVSYCLDVWRTSSTLSLIVQRTVILEPSMWAVFSIVALLQTACIFVSLMHLVVVLHVGKRFCLYEFFELHESFELISCLLAPSRSPGH